MHGHGGAAIPNAENHEPPSLDWTAPSEWKALANPNPMRLATYRVGEGAEFSVARAGGPVDANIARWSQQFEGSPAVERSEMDVRGLHVTVVRIAGTYDASSMGGSLEKRDGWAMRAAIVQAPGAPYFFKLLGPAAQVDAARASFEGLLASVAPRSAR
jgi:hypothetical protein